MVAPFEGYFGFTIFASAVGGMQNSYFFMGLRSLKKIGEPKDRRPRRR